MNKLSKILLAVLGGVEAMFSIALPILVALLWIKYTSINGWSSNALIIVAILASLFRAIKVGWFTKE